MEVSVVLAVASLLLVLSMTGVRRTDIRGRDAQRIADMRTLADAIEGYQQDNGYYPRAATWAQLQTALVPKYLSEMPVDPLNRYNQTPPDNPSPPIDLVYGQDSDGTTLEGRNGSNYFTYTAYPTTPSCTSASPTVNCQGYTLTVNLEYLQGAEADTNGQYQLSNRY